MTIPQYGMPDLARFLVKAKQNAWAGETNEAVPTRRGFKRHSFVDGDWEYDDEYAGFYCAPGQEIVRHKGLPVWAMSYDGGMFEENWGNLDLARETFRFLREALLAVEARAPYRGPKVMKRGSWLYLNDSQGDISRFDGIERIFHDNAELFRQKFIGGVIISK